MGEARTEIRTMNRARANEFERVFLYCPNGHEVVSAATTTRTGRKLLAGDFSDEWCGHGKCGWESE